MSDDIARQEAFKIDQLAKDYLDAMANEAAHPIEAAQSENQIAAKFIAEITPLWQNPDQMQKVARELENINNERWWSTLPWAGINVDSGGKVNLISFMCSSLDFSCRAPANFYSTKETPLR